MSQLLGVIVGGGTVMAFAGMATMMFKVQKQDKVLSNRCRLDDKTVIITGGTSGIGETTARMLSVKHGANVIIPSRNLSKCQETKNKIVEYYKDSSKDSAKRKFFNLLSSGNAMETLTDPSKLIHCHECDLKSLKSVKDFAEKIEKVDVLINNAAVLKPRPNISVNKNGVKYALARTENNIEEQLQVNHLSHFLLSSLLKDKFNQTTEKPEVPVPKLRKTPDKLNWSSTNNLIINVACEAAMGGEFKVSDLERTTETDLQKLKYETRGQLLYKQSKLANLLFTKEAALRWPKITSIAINPGNSNDTNLNRNIKATGFFNSLNKWINPGYWTLFALYAGENGQCGDKIIRRIFSKELVNGGYYVEKEFAFDMTKVQKVIDRDAGKEDECFIDFSMMDDKTSDLLWKYSELMVDNFVEMENVN